MGSITKTGMENRDIKYKCLHCGAKNPKYLGYRNEANACTKCQKKINYFVVVNNGFTGYTYRISIGLTKEGAVEFAKKRELYSCYHNLRILSFDEFEYKVLLDTISSIKEKIKTNEKEKIKLIAELKIKEKEKRGRKK